MDATNMLRAIAVPMVPKGYDGDDPNVAIEFFKGNSKVAFAMSAGPLSEVAGIAQTICEVAGLAGVTFSGVAVGLDPRMPTTDVVDR